VSGHPLSFSVAAATLRAELERLNYFYRDTPVRDAVKRANFGGSSGRLDSATAARLGSE
jgi:hypothetical protein